MALIGAGGLGIFLSLAGLIFVVVAGGMAEAALLRELDTLDRALSATNDGLVIADSTLVETSGTLVLLGSTLGNATRTITETQPALDELQDLTGIGLPQTIESTRQALASAQETARVVDGVLSTVAIFGVPYNPEVPLSDAIGEVSASLAELPASLAEVSDGLGTASANLETVAADLQQVPTGLEAIAANVSEATTVIGQYQTIVADLRAEVASVREAAPGWFLLVRLGLALLLIWLGLANLGLLAQGWALLGGEISVGADEQQRRVSQLED